MRCIRRCFTVAVIGLCWAGGTPARAEGAGGLTPIDARHFAQVRGDRIVIYELDPAHGYQLKVLNTVILDEEGQILGQFRPSEPPAVPSSRPTSPAPSLPSPPARVQPAPANRGPAPLEAHRRPKLGPALARR